MAQKATEPSGHMTGDKGPASLAFMEASGRRHANIMVARTGTIHADISKGMIPHHQGAVEMAKIVLEHGTDPEAAVERLGFGGLMWSPSSQTPGGKRRGRCTF